jgi:DNA-binding LacI/PurR family transcriptional regulator
MVLSTTNGDPDKGLKAAEVWIDRLRVDALIFAEPSSSEIELVERGLSVGLPMAFVAPDAEFPIGHTLRSENAQAGKDLAKLLFSLGHQAFGFMGGCESLQSTRSRLAGLRAGLAQHGLRLPPESALFAAGDPCQAGARHAQRWLALPRLQAPTAVVVSNDTMALSFMRVLRQAGVSIPQDVSVASFGTPEANLYWPGLTTVEQPVQQMGADAVASVIRDVSDGATSSCVEYPMALVERESTGPLGQRYAV